MAVQIIATASFGQLYHLSIIWKLTMFETMIVVHEMTHIHGNDHQLNFIACNQCKIASKCHDIQFLINENC